MAKKRLFLLGSVAFGISFGISFVTGRDIGNAIGTGLTTVAATLGAVVLVDRQHSRQADARMRLLKQHIQTLQQRRADAYHAYLEMAAEKEQLALNLSALHFQPRQPQLLGAAAPPALPSAPKALSWDLSAPIAAASPINVRAHELPTEIQAIAQASDLTPAIADTHPAAADATVAKREIEANLRALRADLTHLKHQITEQRQTRDRLVRELTDLKAQRHQLTSQSKALHDDIAALERRRAELEQTLAAAVAQQQALEASTHPLQALHQQLQTQTTALQDELRQLDAQVTERKAQKAQLEAQLTALNDQLSLLALPVPPQSGAPTGNNGKSSQRATASKPGSPQQEIHPALVRPVAVTANATAAPPVATSVAAPRSEAASGVVGADKADLPPEWTELMVQLPEYEFQVLKAIVEQSHPAAVIKRIAEENLTMPELLIDGINERSLDTIGDILVEANSGFGSAKVVREHLKMAKKMLKAYEFLMN